ncbi:MAG: sodium:calcium antiporter [Sphingobacteriales bacterium]|jgi:cation:H+ antiporter
MAIQFLIFVASLALLVFSARFFTSAAEKIGLFLRMPQIVIGIFIVGIGTSLPELISGSLAVKQGTSEILSGNILGSNISNILLITGLAVVFNQAMLKRGIDLVSTYLFIDLHFLIGSFFYFCMIAYDGVIKTPEALMGLGIFIIYSLYLIRNVETIDVKEEKKEKGTFPIMSVGILLAACLGIYFGAEYTVSSLGKIALSLNVPSSIVALTLLSLGTTLPELVVNISAIRQGKAELAVGNILGSCIFNTLVIPPVASFFGTVTVPRDLLVFSLPVMAASGLLFYMLAADKKMSVYEGLLFVAIYIVFVLHIAFP